MDPRQKRREKCKSASRRRRDMGRPEFVFHVLEARGKIKSREASLHREGRQRRRWSTRSFMLRFTRASLDFHVPLRQTTRSGTGERCFSDSRLGRMTSAIFSGRRNADGTTESRDSSMSERNGNRALSDTFAIFDGGHVGIKAPRTSCPTAAGAPI